MLDKWSGAPGKEGERASPWVLPGYLAGVLANLVSVSLSSVNKHKAVLLQEAQIPLWLANQ